MTITSTIEVFSIAQRLILTGNNIGALKDAGSIPVWRGLDSDVIIPGTMPQNILQTWIQPLTYDAFQLEHFIVRNSIEETPLIQVGLSFVGTNAYYNSRDATTNFPTTFENEADYLLQYPPAVENTINVILDTSKIMSYSPSLFVTITYVQIIEDDVTGTTVENKFYLDYEYNCIFEEVKSVAFDSGTQTEYFEAKLRLIQDGLLKNSTNTRFFIHKTPLEIINTLMEENNLTQGIEYLLRFKDTNNTPQDYLSTILPIIFQNNETDLDFINRLSARYMLMPIATPFFPSDQTTMINPITGLQLILDPSTNQFSDNNGGTLDNENIKHQNYKTSTFYDNDNLGLDSYNVIAQQTRFYDDFNHQSEELHTQLANLDNKFNSYQETNPITGVITNHTTTYFNQTTFTLATIPDMDVRNPNEIHQITYKFPEEFYSKIKVDTINRKSGYGAINEKYEISADVGATKTININHSYIVKNGTTASDISVYSNLTDRIIGSYQYRNSARKITFYIGNTTLFPGKKFDYEGITWIVETAIHYGGKIPVINDFNVDYNYVATQNNDTIGTFNVDFAVFVVAYEYFDTTTAGNEYKQLYLKQQAQPKILGKHIATIESAYFPNHSDDYYDYAILEEQNRYAIRFNLNRTAFTPISEVLEDYSPPVVIASLYKANRNSQNFNSSYNPGFQFPLRVGTKVGVTFLENDESYPIISEIYDDFSAIFDSTSIKSNGSLTFDKGLTGFYSTYLDAYDNEDLAEIQANTQFTSDIDGTDTVDDVDTFLQNTNNNRTSLNTGSADGNLIISFSLPTISQLPVFNDTKGSIIYHNVPTGTAVTSLTPTITLSTGATINPTSGTSQNFTSAVTYVVTALDGSTKQYIVTLALGLGLITDLTGGTDENYVQGNEDLFIDLNTLGNDYRTTISNDPGLYKQLWESKNIDFIVRLARYPKISRASVSVLLSPVATVGVGSNLGSPRIKSLTTDLASEDTANAFTFNTQIYPNYYSTASTVDSKISTQNFYGVNALSIPIGRFNETTSSVYQKAQHKAGLFIQDKERQTQMLLGNAFFENYSFYLPRCYVNFGKGVWSGGLNYDSLDMPRNYFNFVRNEYAYHTTNSPSSEELYAMGGSQETYLTKYAYDSLLSKGVNSVTIRGGRQIKLSDEQMQRIFEFTDTNTGSTIALDETGELSGNYILKREVGDKQSYFVDSTFYNIVKNIDSSTYSTTRHFGAHYNVHKTILKPSINKFAKQLSDMMDERQWIEMIHSIPLFGPMISMVKMADNDNTAVWLDEDVRTYHNVAYKNFTVANYLSKDFLYKLYMINDYNYFNYGDTTLYNNQQNQVNSYKTLASSATGYAKDDLSIRNLLESTANFSFINQFKSVNEPDGYLDSVTQKGTNYLTESYISKQYDYFNDKGHHYQNDKDRFHTTTQNSVTDNYILEGMVLNYVGFYNGATNIGSKHITDYYNDLIKYRGLLHYMSTTVFATSTIDLNSIITTLLLDGTSYDTANPPTFSVDLRVENVDATGKKVVSYTPTDINILQMNPFSITQTGDGSGAYETMNKMDYWIESYFAMMVNQYNDLKQVTFTYQPNTATGTRTLDVNTDDEITLDSVTYSINGNYTESVNQLIETRTWKIADLFNQWADVYGLFNTSNLTALTSVTYTNASNTTNYLDDTTKDTIVTAFTQAFVDVVSATLADFDAAIAELKQLYDTVDSDEYIIFHTGSGAFYDLVTQNRIERIANKFSINNSHTYNTDIGGDVNFDYTTDTVGDSIGNYTSIKYRAIKLTMQNRAKELRFTARTMFTHRHGFNMYLYYTTHIIADVNRAIINIMGGNWWVCGAKIFVLGAIGTYRYFGGESDTYTFMYIFKGNNSEIIKGQCFKQSSAIDFGETKQRICEEKKIGKFNATLIDLSSKIQSKVSNLELKENKMAQAISKESSHLVRPPTGADVKGGIQKANLVIAKPTALANGATNLQKAKYADDMRKHTRSVAAARNIDKLTQQKIALATLKSKYQNRAKNLPNISKKVGKNKELAKATSSTKAINSKEVSRRNNLPNHELILESQKRKYEIDLQKAQDKLRANPKNRQMTDREIEKLARKKVKEPEFLELAYIHTIDRGNPGADTIKPGDFEYNRKDAAADQFQKDFNRLNKRPLDQNITVTEYNELVQNVHYDTVNRETFTCNGQTLFIPGNGDISMNSLLNGLDRNEILYAWARKKQWEFSVTAQPLGAIQPITPTQLDPDKIDLDWSPQRMDIMNPGLGYGKDKQGNFDVPDTFVTQNKNIILDPDSEGVKNLKLPNGNQPATLQPHRPMRFQGVDGAYSQSYKVNPTISYDKEIVRILLSNGEIDTDKALDLMKKIEAYYNTSPPPTLSFDFIRGLPQAEDAFFEYSRLINSNNGPLLTQNLEQSESLKKAHNDYTQQMGKQTVDTDLVPGLDKSTGTDTELTYTSTSDINLKISEEENLRRESQFAPFDDDPDDGIFYGFFKPSEAKVEVNTPKRKEDGTFPEEIDNSPNSPSRDNNQGLPIIEKNDGTPATIVTDEYLGQKNITQDRLENQVLGESSGHNQPNTNLDPYDKDHRIMPNRMAQQNQPIDKHEQQMRKLDIEQKKAGYTNLTGAEKEIADYQRVDPGQTQALVAEKFYSSKKLELSSDSFSELLIPNLPHGLSSDYSNLRGAKISELELTNWHAGKKFELNLDNQIEISKRNKVTVSTMELNLSPAGKKPKPISWFNDTNPLTDIVDSSQTKRIESIKQNSTHLVSEKAANSQLIDPTGYYINKKIELDLKTPKIPDLRTPEGLKKAKKLLNTQSKQAGNLKSAEQLSQKNDLLADRLFGAKDLSDVKKTETGVQGNTWYYNFYKKQIEDEINTAQKKYNSSVKANAKANAPPATAPEWVGRKVGDYSISAEMKKSLATEFSLRDKSKAYELTRNTEISGELKHLMSARRVTQQKYEMSIEALETARQKAINQFHQIDGVAASAPGGLAHWVPANVNKAKRAYASQIAEIEAWITDLKTHKISTMRQMDDVDEKLLLITKEIAGFSEPPTPIHRPNFSTLTNPSNATSPTKSEFDNTVPNSINTAFGKHGENTYWNHQAGSQERKISQLREQKEFLIAERARLEDRLKSSINGFELDPYGKRLPPSDRMHKITEEMKNVTVAELNDLGVNIGERFTPETQMKLNFITTHGTKTKPIPLGQTRYLGNKSYPNQLNTEFELLLKQKKSKGYHPAVPSEETLASLRKNVVNPVNKKAVNTLDDDRNFDYLQALEEPLNTTLKREDKIKGTNNSAGEQDFISFLVMHRYAMDQFKVDELETAVTLRAYITSHLKITPQGIIDKTKMVAGVIRSATTARPIYNFMFSQEQLTPAKKVVFENADVNETWRVRQTSTDSKWEQFYDEGYPEFVWEQKELTMWINHAKSSLKNPTPGGVSLAYQATRGGANVLEKVSQKNITKFENKLKNLQSKWANKAEYWGVNLLEMNSSATLNDLVWTKKLEQSKKQLAHKKEIYEKYFGNAKKKSKYDYTPPQGGNPWSIMLQDEILDLDLEVLKYEDYLLTQKIKLSQRNNVTPSGLLFTEAEVSTYKLNSPTVGNTKNLGELNKASSEIDELNTFYHDEIDVYNMMLDVRKEPAYINIMRTHPPQTQGQLLAAAQLVSAKQGNEVMSQKFLMSFIASVITDPVDYKVLSQTDLILLAQFDADMTTWIATGKVNAKPSRPVLAYERGFWQNLKNPTKAKKWTEKGNMLSLDPRLMSGLKKVFDNSEALMLESSRLDLTGRMDNVSGLVGNELKELIQNKGQNPNSFPAKDKFLSEKNSKIDAEPSRINNTNLYPTESATITTLNRDFGAEDTSGNYQWSLQDGTSPSRPGLQKIDISPYYLDEKKSLDFNNLGDHLIDLEEDIVLLRNKGNDALAEQENLFKNEIEPYLNTDFLVTDLKMEDVNLEMSAWIEELQQLNSGGPLKGGDITRRAELVYLLSQGGSVKPANLYLKADPQVTRTSGQYGLAKISNFKDVYKNITVHFSDNYPILTKKKGSAALKQLAKAKSEIADVRKEYRKVLGSSNAPNTPGTKPTGLGCGQNFNVKGLTTIDFDPNQLPTGATAAGKNFEFRPRFQRSGQSATNTNIGSAPKSDINVLSFTNEKGAVSNVQFKTDPANYDPNFTKNKVKPTIPNYYKNQLEKANRPALDKLKKEYKDLNTYIQGLTPNGIQGWGPTQLAAQPSLSTVAAFGQKLDAWSDQMGEMTDLMYAKSLKNEKGQAVNILEKQDEVFKGLENAEAGLKAMEDKIKKFMNSANPSAHIEVTKELKVINDNFKTFEKEYVDLLGQPTDQLVAGTSPTIHGCINQLYSIEQQQEKLQTDFNSLEKIRSDYNNILNAATNQNQTPAPPKKVRFQLGSNSSEIVDDSEVGNITREEIFLRGQERLLHRSDDLAIWNHPGIVQQYQKPNGAIPPTQFTSGKTISIQNNEDIIRQGSKDKDLSQDIGASALPDHDTLHKVNDLEIDSRVSEIHTKYIKEENRYARQEAQPTLSDKWALSASENVLDEQLSATDFEQEFLRHWGVSPANEAKHIFSRMLVDEKELQALYPQLPSNATDLFNPRMQLDNGTALPVYSDCNGTISQDFNWKDISVAQQQPNPQDIENNLQTLKTLLVEITQGENNRGKIDGSLIPNMAFVQSNDFKSIKQDTEKLFTKIFGTNYNHFDPANAIDKVDFSDPRVLTNYSNPQFAASKRVNIDELNNLRNRLIDMGRGVARNTMVDPGSGGNPKWLNQQTSPSQARLATSDATFQAVQFDKENLAKSRQRQIEAITATNDHRWTAVHNPSSFNSDEIKTQQQSGRYLFDGADNKKHHSDFQEASVNLHKTTRRESARVAQFYAQAYGTGPSDKLTDIDKAAGNQSMAKLNKLFFENRFKTNNPPAANGGSKLDFNNFDITEPRAPDQHVVEITDQCEKMLEASGVFKKGFTQYTKSDLEARVKILSDSSSSAAAKKTAEDYLVTAIGEKEHLDWFTAEPHEKFALMLSKFDDGSIADIDFNLLLPVAVNPVAKNKITVKEIEQFYNNAVKDYYEAYLLHHNMSKPLGWLDATTIDILLSNLHVMGCRMGNMEPYLKMKSNVDAYELLALRKPGAKSSIGSNNGNEVDHFLDKANSDPMNAAQHSDNKVNQAGRDVHLNTGSDIGAIEVARLEEFRKQVCDNFDQQKTQVINQMNNSSANTGMSLSQTSLAGARRDGGPMEEFIDELQALSPQIKQNADDAFFNIKPNNNPPPSYKIPHVLNKAQMHAVFEVLHTFPPQQLEFLRKRCMAGEMDFTELKQLLFPDYSPSVLQNNKVQQRQFHEGEKGIMLMYVLAHGKFASENKKLIEKMVQVAFTPLTATKWQAEMINRDGLVTDSAKANAGVGSGTKPEKTAKENLWNTFQEQEMKTFLNNYGSFGIDLINLFSSGPKPNKLGPGQLLLYEENPFYKSLQLAFATSMSRRYETSQIVKHSRFNVAMTGTFDTQVLTDQAKLVNNKFSQEFSKKLAIEKGEIKNANFEPESLTFPTVSAADKQTFNALNSPVKRTMSGTELILEHDRVKINSSFKYTPSTSTQKAKIEQSVKDFWSELVRKGKLVKIDSNDGLFVVGYGKFKGKVINMDRTLTQSQLMKQSKPLSTELDANQYRLRLASPDLEGEVNLVDLWQEPFRRDPNQQNINHPLVDIIEADISDERKSIAIKLLETGMYEYHGNGYFEHTYAKYQQSTTNSSKEWVLDTHGIKEERLHFLLDLGQGDPQLAYVMARVSGITLKSDTEVFEYWQAAFRDYYAAGQIEAAARSKKRATGKLMSAGYTPLPENQMNTVFNRKKKPPGFKHFGAYRNTGKKQAASLTELTDSNEYVKKRKLASTQLYSSSIIPGNESDNLLTRMLSDMFSKASGSGAVITQRTSVAKLELAKLELEKASARIKSKTGLKFTVHWTAKKLNNNLRQANKKAHSIHSIDLRYRSDLMSNEEIGLVDTLLSYKNAAGTNIGQINQRALRANENLGQKGSKWNNYQNNQNWGSGGKTTTNPSLTPLEARIEYANLEFKKATANAKQLFETDVGAFLHSTASSVANQNYGKHVIDGIEISNRTGWPQNRTMNRISSPVPNLNKLNRKKVITAPPTKPLPGGKPKPTPIIQPMQPAKTIPPSTPSLHLSADGKRVPVELWWGRDSSKSEDLFYQWEHWKEVPPAHHTSVHLKYESEFLPGRKLYVPNRWGSSLVINYYEGSYSRMYAVRLKLYAPGTDNYALKRLNYLQNILCQVIHNDVINEQQHLLVNQDPQYSQKVESSELANIYPFVYDSIGLLDFNRVGYWNNDVF